MDFLSETYPSLYIHILDHFGETDKVHKYMEKCKGYEKDYEKYSLYIHGYWLIWLDQ